MAQQWGHAGRQKSYPLSTALESVWVLVCSPLKPLGAQSKKSKQALKAVVRSKGNKAAAGGRYEYAGGRAQRKRHHDTAAYACADTTSQRR
jgi:hypothetical protein